MTYNKSEKPYEPNPWSMKITIFLGIVFGFLIFSWEIVENIPKYEHINKDNQQLIFNKINGKVYQLNQTPNNDLLTYNLVSVLSEEKYFKVLKKINSNGD